MLEPVEPTHAQVEERAYQIFQERGCEHGGHTEDWLAAEQQLRSAAFERLIRAAAERRIASSRKTRVLAEQASGAAA